MTTPNAAPKGPPPDTPPTVDPAVPKAATPGEVFSRNVGPDGRAPVGTAQSPAPAIPVPPSAPMPATGQQEAPTGAERWDHLDGLPNPETLPDMDLGTSAQPPAPSGAPAGDPGGSPAPQPGTAEFNLGRMRESYESQMAALKTQNEQLTQRLTRYDVTASPEFQSKYDEPIAQTAAQIGEAVVYYGGTTEQAQQLLSLPANERDAWVQENIPSGANAMGAYFGELDRNTIQRASALKNLQQEAAAIAEQRAKQRQQLGTQQQQVIGTLAKKAVAKLENEQFPFFTRVPGNEEWNKKVDMVARYGQNLAVAGSDEQKVEAIMKGITMPYVLNALKAQQQENQELRKRLGIADRVVPQAGNGERQAADGTPRAMTPGEAFAKNVG